MPRKRTSPEEIIHKLREAEILISQGRTVKEAAKQIGVTEQTYYRPPAPEATMVSPPQPVALGLT